MLKCPEVHLVILKCAEAILHALERCVLTSNFPLLVIQLYAALDYSRDARLLTFIALALGLPSSIFLGYKGEALRARYPNVATTE
jgi:hypothetical protein